MVGYALFASSRKCIVGPDTTVALLAASAIAPLAAGDPVRAAALAAALAIMSGVLLMVAARFDLGSVADVLSKPVLVGYANGAALILVASSSRRCSACRCRAKVSSTSCRKPRLRCRTRMSRRSRWACSWWRCCSRAGCSYRERPPARCGDPGHRGAQAFGLADVG